jgi:hypothetical protein
MSAEHRADSAQGVERQRPHIRDREPPRRRLGHPARDVEIHAVRPTDGNWYVGVARDANHFELRTCERMEWVLDGDARRLGSVRCCS